MKKVLFLAVVVLFASGNTQAQERPDHEIHTAMLYNFIKFVQWPNESEPGDFVIGILGEEKVFNTLKKRCDGKPKGNKKYVIKKLGSVAEAVDCQVVYLGKSSSAEFDAMKTIVTGKPILTITDHDGLAKAGSCVNFLVKEGKLKFELNREVIASANLKFDL